MKRLLLALALVAVSVAVAVPVASAKSTTTAPGYNFSVKVIISDKGVVLTRSVARRGWLAHFVIQNRTKQVHRFEIGGLKTPPIKPGHKSRLGAALTQRGQFEYKVDKTRRGYFTVI